MAKYNRTNHNKLRGRDPKFGKLSRFDDETRISLLRELVNPNTAPARLKKLKELFFSPAPVSVLDKTSNAQKTQDDLYREACTCALVDPEWFFAPASKGGPVRKSRDVEDNTSGNSSASSLRSESSWLNSAADSSTSNSSNSTEPSADAPRSAYGNHFTKKLKNIQAYGSRFNPKYPFRHHMYPWINRSLDYLEVLNIYTLLLEGVSSTAEEHKALEKLCPHLPWEHETICMKKPGSPQKTKEAVHQMIIDAARELGKDYVLAPKQKRGRKPKALAEVESATIPGLSYASISATDSYADDDYATDRSEIGASVSDASPGTPRNQVPTQAAQVLARANQFLTKDQVGYLLDSLGVPQSDPARSVDPDSVHGRNVLMDTISNYLDEPAGISQLEHTLFQSLREARSLNSLQLANVLYCLQTLAAIPNLAEISEITQELYPDMVIHDGSNLDFEADSYFSANAPTNLNKTVFKHSVKIGTTIDAYTRAVIKAVLVPGSTSDQALIRKQDYKKGQVVILGDKIYSIKRNLGYFSSRNYKFVFHTSLDNFMRSYLPKVFNQTKEASKLYHTSATYEQMFYTVELEAEDFRDYLVDEVDIARATTDSVEASKLQDVNAEGLDLNLDLEPSVECKQHLNARQQRLRSSSKSFYSQSNRNGFTIYHLHQALKAEQIAEIKHKCKDFNTLGRTFVSKEDDMKFVAYSDTAVYAVFDFSKEEKISLVFAIDEVNNLKRANKNLKRIAELTEELNKGVKPGKEHKKHLDNNDIVKVNGSYVCDVYEVGGKCLAKARCYITNLTSDLYRPELVRGNFRFAEFIYGLYRMRWSIEIVYKLIKRITHHLNAKNDLDIGTIISLLISAVSIEGLAQTIMRKHTGKYVRLDQVIKQYTGCAYASSQDGMSYEVANTMNMSHLSRYRKLTGRDFPNGQDLDRAMQFTQRQKAVASLKRDIEVQVER